MVEFAYLSAADCHCVLTGDRARTDPPTTFRGILED